MTRYDQSGMARAIISADNRNRQERTVATDPRSKERVEGRPLCSSAQLPTYQYNNSAGEGGGQGVTDPRSYTHGVGIEPGGGLG